MSTATPSTATAIVVPVLEFMIPYLLSDITEDIKFKMAVALSAALNIGDPSIVVLTFKEASLRRRKLLQQTGVLVTVGLRGFTGSASQLASKVSLASLNNQLAMQGLKQAQSLQVISTGSNSTGISAGDASTGQIVGGVIGGVCGALLLAGGAVVYMKKGKTIEHGESSFETVQFARH